jgi:hypothetical protein
MKRSRQSRPRMAHVTLSITVAGLAPCAAGLACSTLGTGGGSSGDYAAAFEGPGNPLVAAYELDPSHASSAAISASGGTLGSVGRALGGSSPGTGFASAFVLFSDGGVSSRRRTLSRALPWVAVLRR